MTIISSSSFLNFDTEIDGRFFLSSIKSLIQSTDQYYTVKNTQGQLTFSVKYNCKTGKASWVGKEEPKETYYVYKVYQILAENKIQCINDLYMECVDTLVVKIILSIEKLLASCICTLPSRNILERKIEELSPGDELALCSGIMFQASSLISFRIGEKVLVKADEGVAICGVIASQGKFPLRIDCSSPKKNNIKIVDFERVQDLILAREFNFGHKESGIGFNPLKLEKVDLYGLYDMFYKTIIPAKDALEKRLEKLAPGDVVVLHCGSVPLVNPFTPFRIGEKVLLNTGNNSAVCGIVADTDSSLKINCSRDASMLPKIVDFAMVRHLILSREFNYSQSVISPHALERKIEYLTKGEEIDLHGLLAPRINPLEPFRIGEKILLNMGNSSAMCGVVASSTDTLLKIDCSSEKKSLFKTINLSSATYNILAREIDFGRKKSIIVRMN
ncbi:MAG: hypothetical protein WC222_00015 [Parachlamydiales bacterium]|jgi:hypothetical protein